MKISIQIAEDQWFCLGRLIDKNNHPKLPPFCSYPADNKHGSCAHFSMKEAVDYCLQNPNLSSNITLINFGVYYSKPKIKQGWYYGVQWFYSEDFNCYSIELSGCEQIPFRSLAEAKRYIKDWYETVGYNE